MQQLQVVFRVLLTLVLFKILLWILLYKGYVKDMERWYASDDLHYEIPGVTSLASDDLHPEIPGVTSLASDDLHTEIPGVTSLVYTGVTEYREPTMSKNIARRVTVYREPTLGRRVNLCKHYQHINTSSQEYHHPEIIHYVKLTRTPDQNILTFQEYVSILSAHKFYKPQKIIIHCNRQPFTGPYWDRVANLSTPIELRHTKRVKSINNRGVGFIEHEADYIKVTTAYTEGGIYMDFDVVILNGELLREMQRHSECVIGRDNERCTKICAGFFSSSPRSSFIKNWLEGYKTDYRPSDWVYNAGDVPSNLLRKCPICYNVTVDSHMSNWEDRGKWLKPGQMNWRIKSVAHYMNAGFMKPLKEPEELLKMNTPFTEMIKYVLDS